MKKRACILLMVMAMLLTSAFAGAEVAILDAVTPEELAALTATTIIRDEDSPTGYVVTFRYAAPEAERVRIRGEWNFSDAYHSSTTTSISILPEDWNPDVFPLQVAGDWPSFDMEKDEDTGIWSYTIPLPSGTWSYRFAVDGVEGAELTDHTDATVETDPNNRPTEKVLGEQNNSQVYVPFDPDKQVKDNSIQAPRADQNGTVVNLTYEPVGVPEDAIKDTAAIAVYLPYGYDENREEPYKVLYLSHGSGLESEYSWVNKGSLVNMMDNLVAQERCEPFVVVSLNSYATSFNDANVIENIIPLVEENFNVATEAANRAMAGLSGGARLTLRLAGSNPETFGYYCPMAGELEEVVLDGEKLANAKFHITMGLYERRMDKLTEMEDALTQAGLEYTQAIYAGGHDWFVWRDASVDYVSDLLWK